MFNLDFSYFSNQLKGLFGPVEADKCRVTFNGGVAVKTSKGYRRYDIKTKRLTNVTHFCPDFGQGLFYVFPTNKVEIGDIILDQNSGTPVCVVGVTPKSNEITVIDYEYAQKKIIVPETHILWGSAFYYGKIVSLFGNIMKGSGGMKGMLASMLKFKVLSHLFGMGGNNDDKSKSLIPMGDGNPMNMMAMMMFMGGSGLFGGGDKSGNPFNMFSNMFDGIDFFGGESTETPEEDSEETTTNNEEE